MVQPDHIVAGVNEQRREDAADATLQAGLIVLAAYNLGLALFMTISPHAFYKSVGPFEDLNRHYIRDVATFSAALGFGFVVAIRRPSWRVPVIAITTVQFALHTVNHLFDATSAHPQWTGWFDFVSLLAGTLLLAWMWRAAARRETRSQRPRAGGAERASLSSPSPSTSSPRAERSTT
jgi:hypothetical protein